MFKRLFKKNVDIPVNTKEIIVPCTCEGNNDNCDLILQLRKCQDLRNNIQNEIQILDSDSNGLLCNFMNLLKSLKRNGLYMDKYDAWQFDDMDMCIIKRTVNQYSSADIFRITEELKTYKNKDDIICEKQRALKVVEDNIKNIKTKLGIE